MSSPLINRTALLCRSTLNKPATLSALRFSSTQTKDVQHLENQPVLSVDNLSGAPGMCIEKRLSNDSKLIDLLLEDLLERTVRIFKPSRSASQQGKNGTRLWRIDFDILEDGNRWENPLIGWASR